RSTRAPSLSSSQIQPRDAPETAPSARPPPVLRRESRHAEGDRDRVDSHDARVAVPVSQRSNCVPRLEDTLAPKPEFLTENLPEKPEALVRQTYRLIGTKGMQRLSLQDVADAAGVSKALVVFYFGSRENLVLTTMRWVYDQIAARVTAAVCTADSAEDKVRAM